MTSLTFFLIFIPLLAFILLAINIIFAPHNPYQEKNSAFECGFHSFLGQNRTQFSISFFIFALLFLLFDLEILLVYPYVVSAYTNGIYGLIIMLIFFIALTLGFVFELGKNALKIDSRQNLKYKGSNISQGKMVIAIKNIFLSMSNTLNFLKTKLYKPITYGLALISIIPLILIMYYPKIVKILHEKILDDVYNINFYDCINVILIVFFLYCNKQLITNLIYPTKKIKIQRLILKTQKALHKKNWMEVYLCKYTLCKYTSKNIVYVYILALFYLEVKYLFVLLQNKINKFRDWIKVAWSNKVYFLIILPTILLLFFFIKYLFYGTLDLNLNSKFTYLYLIFIFIYPYKRLMGLTVNYIKPNSDKNMHRDITYTDIILRLIIVFAIIQYQIHPLFILIECILYFNIDLSCLSSIFELCSTLLSCIKLPKLGNIFTKLGKFNIMTSKLFNIFNNFKYTNYKLYTSRFGLQKAAPGIYSGVIIGASASAGGSASGGGSASAGAGADASADAGASSSRSTGPSLFDDINTSTDNGNLNMMLIMQLTSLMRELNIVTIYKKILTDVDIACMADLYREFKLKGISSISYQNCARNHPELTQGKFRDTMLSVVTGCEAKLQDMTHSLPYTDMDHQKIEEIKHEIETGQGNYFRSINPGVADCNYDGFYGNIENCILQFIMNKTSTKEINDHFALYYTIAKGDNTDKHSIITAILNNAKHQKLLKGRLDMSITAADMIRVKESVVFLHKYNFVFETLYHKVLELTQNQEINRTDAKNMLDKFLTEKRNLYNRARASKPVSYLLPSFYTNRNTFILSFTTQRFIMHLKEINPALGNEMETKWNTMSSEVSSRGYGGDCIENKDIERILKINILQSRPRILAELKIKELEAMEDGAPRTTNIRLVNWHIK